MANCCSEHLMGTLTDYFKHDVVGCLAEHARVMALPEIKRHLDGIEALIYRKKCKSEEIDADIATIQRDLRKSYEKLRKRP
jgi:hypothetical protein